MSETEAEASCTVPAARLYAHTVAFTGDVFGAVPSEPGRYLRAVWNRALDVGFVGPPFPDVANDQGLRRPVPGAPPEDADEVVISVLQDVVTLGLRLSSTGASDAMSEVLGKRSEVGPGPRPTEILQEFVVAVRTDTSAPASPSSDVRAWIAANVPAEFVPPGAYPGKAVAAAGGVWFVDASRGPASPLRCLAVVAPPDSRAMRALDDLCWFDGPVAGALNIYAVFSAKLARFQRYAATICEDLRARADALDDMRLRFDRQAQDLKLRAGRLGFRVEDLDRLIQRQIAEEQATFSDPVRVGRYELDEYDENLHQLAANFRRSRHRFAQALGTDLLDDDDGELEVLTGNVAHYRARMRRSLDLLQHTNQLRGAEVARLDLRLGRDRGRLEQLQTSLIGAVALGLSGLQAISSGSWRIPVSLLLADIGFIVPLLLIDLEDPYGPGHVLALTLGAAVAAGAILQGVLGWYWGIIGGGVATVLAAATVLVWGTAMARSLDAGLQRIRRFWSGRTHRPSIDRLVRLDRDDHADFADVYTTGAPPAGREPLDVVMRDVEGGTRHAWVARLDGRVVGLAVVRVLAGPGVPPLTGSGVGLIEYLSVAEDRRGDGIGTKILATVRAARPDLTGWVIAVHGEDETVAIRFLQANRFNVIKGAARCPLPHRSGSGLLPAQLMWSPSAPSGPPAPSGAGLGELETAILMESYGLASDHPLVVEARGSSG